MLGIARGQPYKGAVRRIKEGIRDRIIEIVRNGYPSHLRRRGRAHGHQKQKADGGRHEQSRKQEPRPRFALTRSRALDELADQKIAEDDEDDRNHRIQRRKCAVFGTGDADDVRIITVQEGAENRIGYQRAERPHKVSEKHLLRLHVRRRNPRAEHGIGEKALFCRLMIHLLTSFRPAAIAFRKRIAAAFQHSFRARGHF